MPPKPRIAHLAGSNATIQNSPPLVTSNKAREQYGLPLVTGPDGAPLREELARLGIGEKGIGNLISGRAEIDCYRVVPSSGYTKGLAAKLRADVGEGDIAAEVRGRDFFPYRPYHLGAAPPRPALARIANAVQRVLAPGNYAGAVWTQGSPRIEETVYWLNLLIDTALPICGNASQRPHGQLSNDGDKNIVDSVDYILSRVWADEGGRNRAGVVLLQDQQVFAARDVQKADARPGGYVVTGGHGGILGAAGWEGPAVLNYVPATRQTYLSPVHR